MEEAQSHPLTSSDESPTPPPPSNPPNQSQSTSRAVSADIVLPIAMYNEKTLASLMENDEHTPLLLPTTRDEEHSAYVDPAEEEEEYEFAQGNVAHLPEPNILAAWFPSLFSSHQQESDSESQEVSLYTQAKKVCTSTVVWLNRVAGVAVVMSLVLLSVMALIFFVSEERSSTATSTGTTSGTTTQDALRRSKSNLIVTVLDDQGYSDLGQQSSISDFTPSFNEMFEQGLSITSYYSQSSCTPSRAAMLTGIYPFKMGVQDDIDAESEWGLTSDVTLLPQYLKAVGYDTHMVGKWHLGHASSSMLPQNRGFDTYNGFVTDEVDPFTYVSESSCETVTDPTTETCYTDANFPDLDESSYMNTHIMDVFLDRVESVLVNYHKDSASETNSNNPFFMYLALPKALATSTEPTSIYEAFPDLVEIDDEERMIFSASTASADSTMNAVIAATQAHNLFDDTLFILMSDNGASTTGGGSNFPLKGGKSSMFEGGVRVSCTMYAPALMPPASVGGKYSGLFHAVDWLPTLLYGYLNVDPSDERLQDIASSSLDGINHWSYILATTESSPPSDDDTTTSTDDDESNDETPSTSLRRRRLNEPSQDDQVMYGARQELVLNLARKGTASTSRRLSSSDLDVFDDYTGAVRKGDWKLIINGGTAASTSMFASTSSIAKEISKSSSTFFLVNLKMDPAESTDWSTIYPTKVRELLEVTQGYLDDIVDAGTSDSDPVAAYTAWQQQDNRIVPWL